MSKSPPEHPRAPQTTPNLDVLVQILIVLWQKNYEEKTMKNWFLLQKILFAIKQSKFYSNYPNLGLVRIKRRGPAASYAVGKRQLPSGGKRRGETESENSWPAPPPLQPPLLAGYTIIFHSLVLRDTS